MLIVDNNKEHYSAHKLQITAASTMLPGTLFSVKLIPSSVRTKRWRVLKVKQLWMLCQVLSLTLLRKHGVDFISTIILYFLLFVDWQINMIPKSLFHMEYGNFWQASEDALPYPALITAIQHTQQTSIDKITHQIEIFGEWIN